MPGTRIQCLCVAARDPAAVAAWWQQVLGWRRTHDSVVEVALEPPAGCTDDGVVPGLLFIRVRESKAGKNRLHLDLRPDDQARELERLAGLGATRVDVGQDETATWVVLADPEGNEFCVLLAYTSEEIAQISS